jgi:hypothetical protein
MRARALTASFAFLVLSACATAARPPEERPSVGPAVIASQSNDAAAGEQKTTTPAVLDEVSTNIDDAPVVCRQEIPTGSRLGQLVCRSRAEVELEYRTLGHER